MKRYIPVSQDAEYREYYDSYVVTVDNLNDTDFLYKTSLSNGQVYFAQDEMYGYVNNQAGVRNRNIVITSEYIDDFVIRDFIVYNRNTNEKISLSINCNLHNYRDGKPHFLYIVLSHNGTYEVHDDMFHSNEERILFARFIIDTQGNSVQFYMMLPFAGSADYIKGNQFYQVTDGLRVRVVNNNSKELTLTNAKIRYSAINFDDTSSPDCLEVNFDGATVPIRYIYWDATDSLPRVNWTATPVRVLDSTKIMNYSNGTISTVSTDKFTVQKLYYDVYEKCIVAMYGNQQYNTREEAIFSVDSVLNYPLPDGIEYLIPIAAVISQNSSDPYSEDNFRVVNMDYNEAEVMDSDTFTRQQSAEAIAKANQALTTANNVDTALTNHVGDRTNPHRVALNQLYNSEGVQVALDDAYANYSVSDLIAACLSRVSEDYYAKTGGTISGNASISGTLSVVGATTLSNTTISGLTTINGNILPQTNLTNDIGSSVSRFNNIYTGSINASATSSITGELTTAAMLPSATNTSDIGTTAKRYKGIYAQTINLSGNASISGSLSLTGGASITGNSSVSGNLSVGGSLSANNGYLIIGGCSLRLGSTGSIPTSTGYALV